MDIGCNLYTFRQPAGLSNDTVPTEFPLRGLATSFVVYVTNGSLSNLGASAMAAGKKKSRAASYRGSSGEWNLVTRKRTLRGGWDPEVERKRGTLFTGTDIENKVVGGCLSFWARR